MTRKSLLRLSAAVATAAPLMAAAPAQAQNLGLDQATMALTDTLQIAVDLLPPGITNVRLGLGPIIRPNYEGSNNYNVDPVPVISLRYKNLVEVDNNEIKVTAFNRLFNKTANTGNGSALRVGPLVSVNFGRGENNSPDLRGMGNVSTSIELGGFVSYTFPSGSRVRLRARHDVISGHGGGTVVADYTQVFLRGNRFVLGGIAQGTWATGNFMRSFFGVNAAQAAATGYPVFTPGAGFKDVNFSLNANYQIATQWSVVTNVNYKRLIGGAANSPLVSQVGSPNQIVYTAFAVYTF
jgi:outer membrane protein